jgi:general stress protein CsbA
MALVIAIFTVFYVLNVLYEFSKDGLNVDFTSNTTRRWITGIVVSIIVLASLVVHDFSPDFGKIGIETFLLAISVLMLKYYKAHNRSEKVDPKDMIYTFLIVMGSSLILQSGGIYTHLSMKPFDEVATNV